MAKSKKLGTSSSSAEQAHALREFSSAEIRKATNNFDESLLLRRGGFGEVYKGTFFDCLGTDKTPKTVAVRCFNSKTWQPDFKWLQSEMEAWSQCHGHKNIVSVIGFCQELYHDIIVYEYVSNGSLANHLRKKTSSSSFLLSWEQCISICIDAARGLEYLHTAIKYSCGGRFFHGDVTATDILLDENGIAKLTDLYKEPVRTKYMACCLVPEYQSSGYVGQSSDVYTFGVLLVKVLCRKVWFDKEDKNLIGIWFQECIRNGTIIQIIHPDMKAQIPPDRLKALFHIAGECLDTDSTKRPSAAKLVEKLEFAMASSPQRSCHRYSFREIEEATNNFKNLLGEGGEGKVYRGNIKTRIPIAVKLLKPERSSAFEQEIKILSTLDHPNLVSLIGYCQESDKKILVYECMLNGNLQTAMRTSSLSWEQRLNICIGAARGLRYLHTSTKESPKGVIHRDMKPANILLDENFNAKISDFGLSKMIDQAASEISTALKGTIGYYAPEYLRRNTITRKIDVYAFGVILTEMLCGKKPWDREDSFFPTDQNNERYSLWAKENVNPHLKGTISLSSLEAFTDILEKCLDVCPDRRPSMNDVVSVLENALKWQEAWKLNDSGLLFYLPGGEDRVVLYYTSNSEDVTSTGQDNQTFFWRILGALIPKTNTTPNSGEATRSTFEDCLRVRLFLRRFIVPIDERNPTKDLYAKEFQQIFGSTKSVSLPKVFIGGKYVGGLEILNKKQELAKLLRVPSPRFICKSCGEERSCDVCSREEWYVLCKDCDALTLVSEEWKGDSRSCLECNGNQLICKANLETL